jgi:hypothetical protein
MASGSTRLGGVLLDESSLLLFLLIVASSELHSLKTLSFSCLGLILHNSCLEEIIEADTEDNFFFLNDFFLLLLDLSLWFLDLGLIGLGWCSFISLFNWTSLVGLVWLAAPVASAEATLLLIWLSSSSSGTRLLVVRMGVSWLTLESTSLPLFGIKSLLTSLTSPHNTTSAASFTPSSSSSSSASLTLASLRSTTALSFLGLSGNLESTLSHLRFVNLDWFLWYWLFFGNLLLFLLLLGLVHWLSFKVVVGIIDGQLSENVFAHNLQKLGKI